jgi:hypothetical protein
LTRSATTLDRRDRRSRALRLAGLGVAWALVVTLAPPAALARKGSQPVYQDPFDLAAGGASLTRASKEARLFANPAQLPVGGSFHRWLGVTTSILVNKESTDTARSLVEQSRSGDSEAESDAGDGTESDPTVEEDPDAEASGSGALLDKVLNDPVALGAAATVSWITSNFGLAVFSRLEPEVRARGIGSTGVPEAQLTAESYHGVGLGTAFRLPWKWLSLGVTAKQIYAAEPDLRIAVDGPDAASQLQDPSFLESQVTHNRGTGLDVGTQVFLQGNWLDWTFASVVQDVGDTALVGDGESLTELKQVISVGSAVTLHTGADALHLSLDLRDVQKAYGEETFKRLHAGAKLLIRTYLGLAAGVMDGNPTYGAEVDLIFLRLAAATYTREMGDHPGVDPRTIYQLSLSVGF